MLYYLPERSGGVDCLQTVSNVKIGEMELQNEVPCEEDEYQEYFHYVMENDGMQYPASPEEAFNVFQHLIK